MIRRNRVLLSLALSLLGAAALTGSFACLNVYSPIDKPHGYDETLSAARAAFDRGDVAKAREYYSDLGTDQTAISETVFLNLDGCGANIDAFATALSDGTSNSANPGIMVTDLAEKMNATGLISTACFATLLASYQTAQTQLTDPNLQGFTSFLAALGVMGAVMGTNNLINNTGTLLKTDFITNTVTCNTFPGSCGGCSKADGITGSASVNLASAGSISATWGTFQGAVSAANSALTELGISTGASSTLINFLVTNGAAITNNDNSYRCMLTSFGVGR